MRLEDTCETEDDELDAAFLDRYSPRRTTVPDDWDSVLKEDDEDAEDADLYDLLRGTPRQRAVPAKSQLAPNAATPARAREEAQGGPHPKKPRSPIRQGERKEQP